MDQKNKAVRAWLGLLLAAVAGGAGAGALPSDRLYVKTAPSVWRVFALDANGQMLGQGSGVVLAPAAMITNCHVVGVATLIQVRKDNQSFDARLQYMDPQRDLCQLSVRNLAAPAAALADSDRVVVGQRVYALGNPLGLELTLSDGLVSGLRRDGEDRLQWIQVTAPISPGSSGGALFDEQGRLIGITTGHLFDDEKRAQNLNLAVPSNALRDLKVRSAAYVTQRAAELKVAATLREVAAADAVLLLKARQAKAQEDARMKAALKLRSDEIAQSQSEVRDRVAAGAKAEPEAGAAAAGFTVPVPSGFARIDELAKLDQFAAREGYVEYLRAPYPRAFAITRTGKWFASWGIRPRNPQSDRDPAKRVVGDCEAHHKIRCHIYAVNDTVVYRHDLN